MTVPSAIRQHAPLNAHCVVCGQDNLNGLHLVFSATANGVLAAWQTTTGWESFQGNIHGGILSTVLDEAMSQSIIFLGKEAFTVDLRVRFHKKVAVGELIYVKGWVLEVRKRRILAEACLTACNGEEKAHAWGTFLIP